jgi:hypothetical protein
LKLTAPQRQRPVLSVMMFVSLLSGLGLTIKLSRRRQERLVRRFEASVISSR